MDLSPSWWWTVVVQGGRDSKEAVFAGGLWRVEAACDSGIVIEIRR